VPEQTGTDVARYEFAFAGLYLPMLAAVGVTPATAHVVLTDDRLVARFGPWLCTSPYTNIVDVCETGPYAAVKAIGARLSMTDRGLTFGTTTDGGVCVTFDNPVRGLDPLGVLRHPGLTVTVEDRAGFVAALRRRAGLTRV
jgi:hypothetical protein